MATFPDNFLWGVSTSAHQFEGDGLLNQWSEWERQARIRSGDSCGLACNWWNKPEADLSLCQDLGLNALRISLDWARIEPAPDRWDYAAIDRYCRLVEAIRERGMRPFVTLHHFTHPNWFEARGAFLPSDSPELFARFAEFAASHLSGLCSDWLTFNEPNVYAVFGYMFGEFPPGLRNRVRDTAVVLANIHRAHALAYDVIHRIQRSASVGLATNWVELQSATFSPTDRLLAYLYDGVFNRSTLELFLSGGLQFPFGALAPEVPEVLDKTDFIGLNVYNRLHVRSPWNDALRRTGGLFVPEDAPQGDPGIELPYGEAYPDGVISAVREYARLHVPIYITENGVPDRDDRIRPWVLVQTLRNVSRLISEGFDLRGYFHWSIVDNFEWNEGWTLRFGLYELDCATQVRTPRRSAHLYREIVRANKISDELLSRFSEPPAAGGILLSGGCH